MIIVIISSMKHVVKIKEVESVIGVDSSNISEDIDITGICYDSRNVKKGDIFVCLIGEKTDGHKYIKAVEEKGASAILAQKKIDTKLPVIYSKDTQKDISKLATMLYKDPSKEIRMIGVTGTNGKTTTTHLIQHMLEKNGLNTALIGTLGTKENTSSNYYDSKHTTPQAPDLQENLFNLKSKGIKNIAMEVSSHALSLYRVDGCNFCGAVMTNLTQDHLDFHLTMEEYSKAKQILFKQLEKSSHENKFAVLNADDKYYEDFKGIIPKNVKLVTYGIKNTADFMAKDIKYEADGLSFTLTSPDGEVRVKSMLNGGFNTYNVLASIAACHSEGLTLEQIANSIKNVSEVAGRFQIIKEEDSPICIVDYAHTPDGLENVLRAAKVMVPTGSKLISVFGCGGDRDPTKRPKMGKISEDIADLSIVTSDNPRTEDPKQIISDILTGIENTSNIIVEAERKDAIKLAIKKATNTDIVVIAGKGHEDYQILKEETIHFDDREEVKEALKKRRGKSNIV